MKSTISLLLCIVLASQVYSCATQEPDSHIHRDFSSTQRLLDWFDQGMPESDIDLIAALPGMQLMEQNALRSEQVGHPENNEKNPPLGFADALRQFRAATVTATTTATTDTTTTATALATSSDIYGISQAYHGRERIAALMKVLIERDFCDSAYAYAARFLPQDASLDVTFSSYFVPTGWRMGDAYIRRVMREGDTYIIDAQGEPTSFFNLQLISDRYGETPEDQIESLKDVTAHEIFHLLFDSYKRQSNRYAPIASDDYMGQLRSIVHNEGIAHYICYRSTMQQQFKDFESHQEQAFTRLGEVVALLAGEADGEAAGEAAEKTDDDAAAAIDDDTPDDSPEEISEATTEVTTEVATEVTSEVTSEVTPADASKQQLLYEANTGSFWNKYGALSGMFMAYHIENELGFAALINTVAMGDDSFFQSYRQACLRNDTLPLLE